MGVSEQMERDFDIKPGADLVDSARESLIKSKTEVTPDNVTALLLEASKLFSGDDWPERYAGFLKKKLTISVTEEQVASLLRDAAKAHHGYEATLGAPDKDWQAWYAKFFVDRVGK